MLRFCLRKSIVGNTRRCFGLKKHPQIGRGLDITARLRRQTKASNENLLEDVYHFWRETIISVCYDRKNLNKLATSSSCHLLPKQSFLLFFKNTLFELPLSVDMIHENLAMRDLRSRTLHEARLDIANIK